MKDAIRVGDGVGEEDMGVIDDGLAFNLVDDDPDTPEGMDLAAEDAARDMEGDEEGEASPGFFGSYLIRHGSSGECEHGVCVEKATSFAEAVGLMYMEVSREYPSGDGWLAPHIIAHPDPFLIVDWAPVPVIMVTTPNEGSSNASEQV